MAFERASREGTAGPRLTREGTAGPRLTREGSTGLRPTREGAAREKSLERQIRAFHWVRLLAEIPHRLVGTAGEREAAARTASWLEEIGFESVRREEMRTPPARSARLALALAVGLAGALLGGALGALAGGLAWASFRREQREDGILLSRWLPHGRGQNVVARAGSSRPRVRIVLTASLDAPRQGRVFQESWARLLGLRRVRERGPLALCEGLLAVGFGLGAAGWLGAGGALLTAAWTFAALGLAAATALALQWARAEPTTGANDNAAGVAAMLTCAEQLEAQLRHDVELFAVATTGGQAGACGLRAALAAHPEWATERTLFVHFDCLGGGRLHYLRSEGPLTRRAYPPRLLELARRIAEGGAFAEVTAADYVGETEGRVTAARSLHALTLIALDERGGPVADHGPGDVVDALDMATVVRAADFAAAILVASWRGESDPLALV